MGSVSTIDLQEGGTLMNCEKYIGLDVHQATISVAVMDPNGKLVMECIHSRVLCGATRQSVGRLRRRNLGGLALRSPQASCRPSSGLQSAQDRSWLKKQPRF